MLGIFTWLNVWGVYGSRAAEEIIKSVAFFLRFRTQAWYQRSSR
jgi:Na+-driven multidrug efflux pump